MQSSNSQNSQKSQVVQSMSTALPIQGYNEENIIQLIIFHVGAEEFGVPIGEILEIIKINNITPIPDVPAFIKGIINVRGDIVTVIDLKSRFNILTSTNENAKHIVISKQHDNLFGLMVDEVTEVLRVNKNEIKMPPTLSSKVQKEYFNGVVILDERLIILLDLKKVLSEKELEQIIEKSSSIKREKIKNENSQSNDENKKKIESSRNKIMESFDNKEKEEHDKHHGDENIK